LSPRISLITVCFNAERTIERCVQSVAAQCYKNVEYILIDGGSFDNTLQIINKYAAIVTVLISEKDSGIYDAMNKGIATASGDVIGMLNADDYFADENILDMVAQSFKDPAVKLLYGDLDFVNCGGMVVRRWRSGNYSDQGLRWGWMPPHPTFYGRKDLFSRYDGYSLGYGSAGDYELMLRFMFKHRIPAFYLSRIMVKMEVGGESSKDVGSRLRAFYNDFKALRDNGIGFPWLKAVVKRGRKIGQFLYR
jgi:glycosyltransferase involved in cell wall biosynthesis